MLQKNNPPVRISMASYLAVGIAWQKMDTQTSSVTQQKSVEIFTVIDFSPNDTSYLNITNFFCAKIKNTTKSAKATATIGMHSQGK